MFLRGRCRLDFLFISMCWPHDFSCGRSPDGEMFVVKDPEAFAAEIIPQYFDHNKVGLFFPQLLLYL